MQISKNLLMGILFLFSLSASAQSLSSVKGKLTDAKGEALSGVAVKIKDLQIGALSNEKGEYFLKEVPVGNQTLVIEPIGYKKQQIKITVNAGITLVQNVKLSEDVQQMETVQVYGRTKVQEVNRQAFNVTAIDAKALYNTTLDVSSALDKVSGIRVRESGGVGSNFNLSLNGFSGNRVKYFIDGIPMDNFGSSFQINNIPINVAERVEVYKGVVPIWLGSDALGGAINIVTGERSRNYVDASYSYGSFNTHRSVVNAAVTTEKGLTFRLNAFQNYSDNNYKVTVDAADIYSGEYTRDALVSRFHDTYHNETLIANVGFVDKKFADQLLLGLTAGQNYKEIQTSVRMVVPYGGWHRRGNILMPTLKYKKTNLIKGLDLTLNANYNFGKERNIDTVNARFDWYGNSKYNANGEGRGRTLSNYGNNNGLVTTNANYKIDDHQAIALSEVFNTFNRKGTDVFSENFTQGPNRPRLNKNVLGLGYSYNKEDKWGVSVFGKHLSQKTASGSGINKLGYGIAASYFVSSNFQFKASYEQANRLPEATELFGDVELVQGNLNLKPEQSDNINAGFAWNFALNKNHNFIINANAIYRNATNYIYQRFNTNQSSLILDNLDGVTTTGGEGELRYSFKNWLSAGTSITYQHILNQQEYVFDANGNRVKSPVFEDQMPNIPYFFGNADVSVTLRDLAGKNNNLNLGYNLLYVHEFWLYWPSQGGTKFNVPQQLSHDLSAVYSLKNGRYNIGLEVRNITNEKLYDNFSLQKPGRAFYLNLRYFFNSFKI